MPKEGQPQSYQFKHAKHISMDGYRGIASDLMQLNHPVTDGFMQATDMRSDIVVTNVAQGGVADYDQIESGVKKIIHLPPLNSWHQSGATHTMRNDGTWFVAVDDQKLSQDVSQKQGKGKDFDKTFSARFQQEMAKGIESCLKREKLLNNGNYLNISFLLGYKTLIAWNVLFPVLMGITVDPEGRSAFDMLKTNATFIAGTNVLYNGLYLALSRVRKKALELNIADDNVLPNYQDPLIKHHILEYVAPPIALDRVTRGLVYMRLHGKQLILPQ